MRLLFQRFFSLWIIDPKAASVLSAIMLTWLIVIAETIYLVLKHFR